MKQKKAAKQNQLNKKGTFWNFYLALTGFLNWKPLCLHPPNYSYYSHSFNFPSVKKWDYLLDLVIILRNSRKSGEFIQYRGEL